MDGPCNYCMLRNEFIRMEIGQFLYVKANCGDVDIVGLDFEGSRRPATEHRVPQHSVLQISAKLNQEVTRAD